jgi:hypothetical protein
MTYSNATKGGGGVSNLACYTFLSGGETVTRIVESIRTRTSNNLLRIIDTRRQSALLPEEEPNSLSSMMRTSAFLQRSVANLLAHTSATSKSSCFLAKPTPDHR